MLHVVSMNDALIDSAGSSNRLRVTTDPLCNPNYVSKKPEIAFTCAFKRAGHDPLRVPISVSKKYVGKLAYGPLPGICKKCSYAGRSNIRVTHTNECK